MAIIVVLLPVLIVIAYFNLCYNVGQIKRMLFELGQYLIDKTIEDHEAE